MAKPKTLEQLRAEKERPRHSLHRNSTSWSVWRTERSIWRKARDKSAPIVFAIWAARLRALPRRSKISHRAEMTELMEHIFSLSEVQRAVRHMAITHISQANREKELKADGTISSERHAD